MILEPEKDLTSSMHERRRRNHFCLGNFGEAAVASAAAAALKDKTSYVRDFWNFFAVRQKLSSKLYSEPYEAVIKETVWKKMQPFTA